MFARWYREEDVYLCTTVAMIMLFASYFTWAENFNMEKLTNTFTRKMELQMVEECFHQFNMQSDYFHDGVSIINCITPL